MQERGGYTFRAHKTLSLPRPASSPNTSASSPGLNVEIVGGSSVLVVMDGSREDYSKNLQLRQPVLKGRLQSNQIICPFLCLPLADDTPCYHLPTLQLASDCQTHVFGWTEMVFLFCKETRGMRDLKTACPARLKKLNNSFSFFKNAKKQ